MLPSRAVFEYNTKDCVGTSIPYTVMLGELQEEPGEWRVYNEIALPLIEGVMRMRERGMPVDLIRRAAMITEAEMQLESQERELKAAIGDWFEPTNRNHIAKFLFEIRKLTPLGYTQKLGRPRVDKESLITILLDEGDKDPIYDQLMTYLDLQKFCSTFLQGVIPSPNGRIYTYWLIHGTATGRLASRKPDMQNLPKEEPRNARRMFVAPRGYVFIAADASQLELRLLAYATECKFLMTSIEAGKDLHSMTAANNYRVPIEAVQPTQRRVAKNYRYAEVYGAGDERIRTYLIVKQRLRVPLQDIASFRRSITAQEPEVQTWRERQLAELRVTRKSTNGYGRTRRVFVPDADLRGIAFNNKIQSTAADYINRVFIRLDRQGAPIVAQVHDEILLLAPVAERDMWCERMREAFEEPQPLFDRKITLPCDLSVGEVWGQLQKVG